MKPLKRFQNYGRRDLHAMNLRKEVRLEVRSEIVQEKNAMNAIGGIGSIGLLIAETSD